MAVARYEFRIDGRLSERTQAEFQALAVRGLRIRPAPPQTVLTAEIADQSEVYGLLARFQDLGLTVVSMRQDS